MSIFKKDEPVLYDLSEMTILLVEDSHYMQSLMILMLKAFGVGDIMACSNAQEAIDILKVTQARRKSRYVTNVDIVLTDWLMPAGPGEDLLKWIRSHKDDSIRFLPVVVVSAYTTEKVVSRARDLGANETLVKPVSGKGLASRICAVIDKARPFVSIDDYFGPDRRRQSLEFEGPDRRMIKQEQVKVTREKTVG
ncbi:MAG: response regulator [Alphaproteobacteria bacterium]|nr:response regulator [Alphaproteobacteria bacterium]